MKRKEEEFAKKAFLKHLGRCGLDQNSMEDSERPDYLLKVGVHRYAVEVTQVMQAFELNGHQFPSRQLNNALERFVQRVQDRARNLGILSGTYIVGLEAISDFEETAPLIEKRCLNYIRRTQRASVAMPEIVLNRASVWWEIQKLAREGCSVSEIDSTGDAMWPDEIRRELREVLVKRLADKIVKLKHVEIPVILLLVDDYHLASPDDWPKAIPACLLQRFHTVARVHGDYECQVLWSMNSAWLRPRAGERGSV